MAGKAKAAPRRGRGASGSVLAAERDPQKNTPTTDKMQGGAVEVYDGRAHAGSLVARGNGWLATSTTGKFLGSYTSDRVAARAIYEAARPGRAS